jgi:hypothetical protein
LFFAVWLFAALCASYAHSRVKRRSTCVEILETDVETKVETKKGESEEVRTEPFRERERERERENACDKDRV